MCVEVLVSDIGGVVIDRKNGGHEPSFSRGNHRESPEISGAIAGLAELRKEKFGPCTYTLSRTESDYTIKTYDWFDAHDFFGKTGIAKDHARFCEKKIAKVDFYKKVRATHIIDDREENIRHVLEAYVPECNFVPSLILFCGNGHRDDPHYGLHLPPNVYRAHSWWEVLQLWRH